jgi:hypothetical protein
VDCKSRYNSQIDQVLCAIDLNAGVRTFDWFTLIASALAAAAVAIALFVLERKHATDLIAKEEKHAAAAKDQAEAHARESRKQAATHAFLESIDRLNLSIITGTGGPAIQFNQGIRGDLDYFLGTLGSEADALASQIRGEVEYAGRRIDRYVVNEPGLWSNLVQLKADVARAIRQWESDPEHKKGLETYWLRKGEPYSMDPLKVPILTANS